MEHDLNSRIEAREKARTDSAKYRKSTITALTSIAQSLEIIVDILMGCTYQETPEKTYLRVIGDINTYEQND